MDKQTLLKMAGLNESTDQFPTPSRPMIVKDRNLEKQEGEIDTFHKIAQNYIYHLQNHSRSKDFHFSEIFGDNPNDFDDAKKWLTKEKQRLIDYVAKYTELANHYKAYLHNNPKATQSSLDKFDDLLYFVYDTTGLDAENEVEKDLDGTGVIGDSVSAQARYRKEILLDLKEKFNKAKMAYQDVVSEYRKLRPTLIHIKGKQFKELLDDSLSSKAFRYYKEVEATEEKDFSQKHAILDSLMKQYNEFLKETITDVYPKHSYWDNIEQYLPDKEVNMQNLEPFREYLYDYMMPLRNAAIEEFNRVYDEYENSGKYVSERFIESIVKDTDIGVVKYILSHFNVIKNEKDMKDFNNTITNWKNSLDKSWENMVATYKANYQGFPAITINPKDYRNW